MNIRKEIAEIFGDIEPQDIHYQVTSEDVVIIEIKETTHLHLRYLDELSDLFRSRNIEIAPSDFGMWCIEIRED